MEDEAMQCMHCGEENRSEVAFCCNCGSWLTRDPLACSRLLLLGERGKGEYVLATAERIFGRDVDDCDIALDDELVSARHGRLYRNAEGYYLEDLKSTNGTYVNGQRLSAVARLRGGELIKMGRTLLTFRS